MTSAVAALRKMLVKLKDTLQFEIVTQYVPQHLTTYVCRCTARGCMVSATARTKRIAKQGAARVMLILLKARGDDMLCPIDCPQLKPPSNRPGPAAPSSGPKEKSYKALLNELCVKHHLPGVQYELVIGTGPPRPFIVRACVGQHSRLATSTTKMTAQQLAAQKLYSYLRDNLVRLRNEFDEEQLFMWRYVEAISEEAVWQPDLGQRVSDYHLGMVTQVDAGKCKLALEVVETWHQQGRRKESAVCAVEAAAAALGIACTWSTLDLETQLSAPLCVLELCPLSPAVALGGRGRTDAATAALQYLDLYVRYSPPKPRVSTSTSACASVFSSASASASASPLLGCRSGMM